MKTNEIKEAFEASKNETIASRAEEIISYILNKEEDDVIQFQMSFAQVMGVTSSSVTKTYNEERYQYFLADIEAIEGMWKMYDENIGYKEDVDHSGIHWTMELDVTNNDGFVMKQIVDFHIWKFFEKED